MRAALCEVRAATAAEWDAAYAACSASTYSLSRAWAEDWSLYAGGRTRPAPTLLRFGDGLSVVVPLSSERRRFSRRFLASPAGMYGGWLSVEPLGRERTLAVSKWLAQSRLPLWWRINPFDAHSADLASLATEGDITHVIRLAPGFDDVCRRAGHGHRCAVRKAKKSGVVVRCARNAEDWAEYYKIYLDSLRRWGDAATSRYDAPLFESLRRRGDDTVRLWLATADERLTIAGGICLYAPRHVTYWHAAARSEYFFLRPANLLVYEMVKDAFDRGLEWFDMNPDGGHEGVRVFKERVGAEELPSPVVVLGRRGSGAEGHARRCGAGS
ncbi:MAG TPA: GNAT family N-acetyltransferase [Thermoleophilia bacterium]|nr:GNAT family N-acetyltransferase [Thermoleophilia bacterium]HQJ97767.1 GNAT family N-acetyltransferase [Thermoleophilia bacterium]